MEQYDPAGHAVHAVIPVEAANVPIKQDEQIVDEAAEYFPEAQLPVTANRPVVAQYDPPGQLVQEDVPVDAA